MKKWMRIYTTAILCVTSFFLYADQNLLSPNLSTIAKEFQFSAKERDEKLGGNIALGFFCIGGPAALVVGYFADVVNRCHLFGVVVLLGEGACLATYWVKDYTQLLACRILTGVSMGGATPIIFSLLGDLYPGESRVYVSSLIGIAMSTGIGFGQLVAGTAGPAYGWRSPFLIVAVPALFCAILSLVSAEEPERGGQEQEVRLLKQAAKSMRAASNNQDQAGGCQESHGSRSPLKEPLNHAHYHSTFLRSAASPSYQRLMEDGTRTVAITDQCDDGKLQVPQLLASQEIHSAQQLQEEGDLPTMVAATAEYSERIDVKKLGVMFSTLSALIIFVQGFPGCIPWGMVYVFLNDYLSYDRGMSIQGATFALTSFALGGLLGQALCGYWGQLLYNRDIKYQCLLMGLSTLAALPPMFYLLNVPDPGGGLFYFVAVLAGFLISANGPNVRVVLQNVCSPEVRGTAFAVFTLADDIGKGMGPFFVVQFIQASNGNRRKAFNEVVLFWGFCGVMLLLLMLTAPNDEKRVQARIRRALGVASRPSSPSAVARIRHCSEDLERGQRYHSMDDLPEEHPAVVQQSYQEASTEWNKGAAGNELSAASTAVNPMISAQPDESLEQSGKESGKQSGDESNNE